MKLCLNCIELFDEQYEVCPFCGNSNQSKNASAEALSVGTIIRDRYVVGSMIGRGGFGISYVGWDNLLKQKIAIKEYFPNRLAYRDETSSKVLAKSENTELHFTKGIMNFMEESRKVATLNKEPGVVHIYDYLQENGTAYIVMEFIDGQSLQSKIKHLEAKDDKLSISESVRIAKEASDVLRRVHDTGLIHRDISIDNIMLDEAGSVVIIDFGAAKAYQEEDDDKSRVLKQSYAPPEQFDYNRKQDERTDVFSLGVVMYRMLTGKMPTNAMQREAGEELTKPSKLSSDIPSWLEAIVLKCIELKPENRFQNMKELNASLKKNATAATNKKRRTKVFSIIAILLILVGAATYVYTKEDGPFDVLKIHEYGYHYVEDTGDVRCGVILENTSEDLSIRAGTKLKLTAYDESGNVIGEGTQVLGEEVYTGDSLGVYVPFYRVCDTAPARVELEIVRKKFGWQDFWIDEEKEDIELKRPSYDGSVRWENGELVAYFKNECNRDIDTLLVVELIYRDSEGNIVDAEEKQADIDYVYDCPGCFKSGETRKFIIDVDQGYDRGVLSKAELYVIPRFITNLDIGDGTNTKDWFDYNDSDLRNGD